ASSNSGPRSTIWPPGLTTTEPPGKPFPPSNPTRLAYATYTPCSSARLRRIRSQRTTLAGSRTPSSSIQVPRAGDALGTRMSWAPSSAAIVPAIECQASSQIKIPKPRASGDRDLAHPAFHEVAGGRGLGEDHQVDGRLELRELCQHPADPLQVGGVLALGGADLGYSDPRHECGGKIIAAGAAVSDLRNFRALRGRARRGGAPFTGRTWSRARAVSPGPTWLASAISRRTPGD